PKANPLLRVTPGSLSRVRDGGQGFGIGAVGLPNLDRHRTPLLPRTPRRADPTRGATRCRSPAGRERSVGSVSLVALATPVAPPPPSRPEARVDCRGHDHHALGESCTRTVWFWRVGKVGQSGLELPHLRGLTD